MIHLIVLQIQHCNSYLWQNYESKCRVHLYRLTLNALFFYYRFLRFIYQLHFLFVKEVVDKIMKLMTKVVWICKILLFPKPLFFKLRIKYVVDWNEWVHANNIMHLWWNAFTPIKWKANDSIKYSFKTFHYL